MGKCYYLLLFIYKYGSFSIYKYLELFMNEITIFY
jgi:hypothetical protein